MAQRQVYEPCPLSAQESDYHPVLPRLEYDSQLTPMQGFVNPKRPKREFLNQIRPTRAS